MGGDYNYAYGLIICIHKNEMDSSDEIVFLITQSGYYLIAKEVDGIDTIVVNWTASSHILPNGAKNKLSVEKSGNQFLFFINDNQVKPPYTISGFSGGALGVISSQNVDVSFDDFTITQPGTPPYADAGPNQSVVEGSSVNLIGSGSNDDIGIASYQWHQLQGIPVIISDPTTVNPTFTAPEVSVPKFLLAFQLKVTDGDRLHDSDITVVEVSCLDATGDVNGDCNVDLQDGIIPLQVVAGETTANVRSDYVLSGVDVSGDNLVGTEESINALREEAGL